MLVRLVEVNYWQYIIVSLAITGSTAHFFGTSWANTDRHFLAPCPWEGTRSVLRPGSSTSGTHGECSHGAGAGDAYIRCATSWETAVAFQKPGTTIDGRHWSQYKALYARNLVKHRVSLYS